MIFNCKLIGGRCLAGALALVCAQLCHAQGKETSILDERVKAITIREPTINLALSTIAREYHVPIGVEMAVKKKEQLDQEIAISLKDGTLRDLLNAVVKQDRTYNWKIVDEVVNVYPRDNHDPLLEDLLNTKIERFALGDNPTIYRIRNDIVELPEIRSKLEKARVTPHIVAYTGIDFERVGREFSMGVSNVTLQRLLNQIIRQSGVKFWILNRFGENNEWLILNF